MGRTMQKQRSVQSSKTSQIPKALLDIVTELKALDEDNNNQNINYKYLLGKRFLEVTENPQTFGKDGRKILMEELGIRDNKAVDRPMLFATTYTAAQVEAFNHRYDDCSWAKTRITWSHWDKLLAGYLSPAEREQWMDATVRNGWNATELSHQLAARNKEGSKNCRPVKKPDSKAALLDKMKQPLDIFSKYYHSIWDDKDNSAVDILAHDFNDVDEDTVGRLDNLTQTIEDAIAYLQAMLDDIQKNKVKDLWIKKIQEGPKEEEITAADADDDDDDASSLVASVL